MAIKVIGRQCGLYRSHSCWRQGSERASDVRLRCAASSKPSYVACAAALLGYLLRCCLTHGNGIVKTSFDLESVQNYRNISLGFVEMWLLSWLNLPEGNSEVPVKFSSSRLG